MWEGKVMASGSEGGSSADVALRWKKMIGLHDFLLMFNSHFGSILHRCNLYGVVSRVVITGLGIVMRELKKSSM